MKQILAFAISTALTVGAANASDVGNLKAFCAIHKNRSGEGLGELDSIPAEVGAAGATNWRCMNGKVLVCNGGASGRACMKSEKVDARRRAAFSDFCRQNPNADIPDALTTGLSSEWKCVGTRPTQVGREPIDRLGFLKGSWRPLP
ncbi:MAG: hypothetical protein JO208_01850 [Alphaproteobacteria bacterium]|nr:hypothetical protein [Alphaproteobacteria bacterium]